MMRSIGIATAMSLAIAVLPARAEDPPAPAWIESWNAPANHEDIGRFVAADTPDRIYVAGTTYEPGIGGAMYDFLLLQYDANGNLAWSRRYGGEGSEVVSDLEVPVSGEVVVTGYSTGLNGIEVATVNYDHLGNLVWERRYPVQGVVFDHGPRLAVAGDGSILVSTTDSGDYRAIKYAPDGTFLWSTTYDGPDGGGDIATDIAADGAGNAYLTGASNDMRAFATVKFDPGGGFVWEQLEPGDIGSVFAPSRVAVGPDGDPVVAGSPESTCGVFQFKIWKCAAADGAALWFDEAPDQPCGSFTFRDMAVHWTGDIAAVCFGSPNGGIDRMQVLRYSPNGTREWIREFDGAGTAEDVAAAVAFDAAGAIYAAGHTTNPPQNRDYAAVKYSPSGAQEWSVSWASTQGTNDIGQDIAVDPAGSVIITGNSYHPVENENVVTVKYRQASSADVAQPSGGAVAARAIRVSPNPILGEARIEYGVPRGGAARIEILSTEGRRIRTLADRHGAAGYHAILWDGTDGAGDRLPSGMYFVRLVFEGSSESAKIQILPQ